MSISEDVAIPGIDLPSLLAFLTERWGPCDGRRVEIEPLAGGRSNLTYGLSWAGHRLVLRRPPLGGARPSAHDMGREFRVLTGLASTAVPVPEPVLFL